MQRTPCIARKHARPHALLRETCLLDCEAIWSRTRPIISHAFSRTMYHGTGTANARSSLWLHAAAYSICVQRQILIAWILGCNSWPWSAQFETEYGLWPSGVCGAAWTGIANATSAPEVKYSAVVIASRTVRVPASAAYELRQSPCMIS